MDAGHTPFIQKTSVGKHDSYLVFSTVSGNHVTNDIEGIGGASGVGSAFEGTA